MHNLTQNLLIKAILVCILMVHLSKSLQAQKNLVPNPSFENLVNCNMPLNNVVSWYGVNGSTTYTNINTCFNNSSNTTNQRCCSVPFNTSGFGYQYPRTGNSMIGIFTLENLGLRNYPITKLVDSLSKNKIYYVEFFVNTEDGYNVASNNIGLAFSDTNIQKQNYSGELSRFGIMPHILAYGNPIIFDTLGWVKIAGLYKAHEGEQYLVLGNFYDNASTKTLKFQTSKAPGGGICIDDVSVIPLDSIQLQADAGRDTTITKGDSAFIGTLINGLDTVKWQVLVNGQVIDTIRPGFWVKPTTNTCYVLTQTVNGYTSSDTVCVYVNALPVRFISLTLNPSPTERDLIALKFSTANEINVSHYTIQYSTNGKDFKTTGNHIPAKGGSLNEYVVSNSPPLEGLGVVDGVANNIVYYRIQATDHDGQQTFSEIKSIKLNTAGVVTIYPNPANNEVTVTGKNIQQISISDVAGKTLISTNNKKINISSLPNGTYFISIKTTHTYEVQKLVKW